MSLLKRYMMNILCIISILCIALIVYRINTLKVLRERDQRCTVEDYARIVHLEYRKNLRGYTRPYNPTFEFTLNGDEISTILETEDVFFEVGKAYKILYNPDNPKEITLVKGDPLINKSKSQIAIAAFVLIFSVAGAVGIYREKNKVEHL